MIAYHGTRHSILDIDPELGACGAAWFTTSIDTAEAFGAHLSRGERRALGAHPVTIFTVEIVADLKVIDIMAEAVALADQLGAEVPTTWDEAAELVQWGSYQDDLIRETRAEGYAGIRFVGCGDCPRGFSSDHIAIFDAAAFKVIEVASV